MVTRLLRDLEKQDTLSADKLAELGDIVADLATLIEQRNANGDRRRCGVALPAGARRPRPSRTGRVPTPAPHSRVAQ